MAKKVKVDYAAMSDAELSTTLNESKSVLANDMLNHAVTPLENPKSIMHQRRAIARIKTELRKRELSK